MTQPTTPVVPRNGFGIAILALAIIGLAFALVPFTRFIALALGVLAVLLGLLGWSRIRRGLATDRGMIMLGTVLGIGAGALGGLLGYLQQPVHTPSVVDDAVVLGCSVRSEDGVAAVQATVKITNTTDRVQTYLTTIGVNDASGAQIGKINTVSSPLGAGESVTVSGIDASDTALSGAHPGPATCVVTNVNRLPPTSGCLPGEVDAKLC